MIENPLKVYKAKHKLTNKDLVCKSGGAISESQLSLYEKHACTLTYKAAQKIAPALGTTPEVLQSQYLISGLANVLKEQGQPAMLRHMKAVINDDTVPHKIRATVGNAVLKAFNDAQRPDFATKGNVRDIHGRVRKDKDIQRDLHGRRIK